MRVRRRWRSLRAKTRHRLGIPPPEAGTARVATEFRHPIAVNLRPALVERYRMLFPEAATTECEQARRLSAHRFHLLGHEMCHGDRVDWSRDPVSGREWPRRHSGDITYRGADSLGDIKLPWELNKHQYFFTLGKAAWLTGDPASAIEIVRQIDHWIGDNPCQTGIHWISPLEVGARAVSWITAYPFYAECGDAAFHSRLVGSLAQHVLFVEQHLSVGAFANTHLVGEAAALVAGGQFLDSPHSARWLATGLRILDDAIQRQVGADGFHAEQSVAYHRFFLDQYYLVAAWLAANGRSLSDATLERVQCMTAALMHMLLPDGTVPSFGDSDDARGIWVRADCPTDYRGLLALGAVLFGREDFKAAAGTIAEEVLWLHGLNGVAAFDALSARTPGETSVTFPDAGYSVMRSGYGSSDSVLVFDCGPVGFGAAAHGHADALSVQLYAAGCPFLVDPGTFSYNLDPQWRDAFRGTRAHNTVTVDGLDQSVPGGRMAWQTKAQSLLNGWITTRWFDLVDGEHDGYGRLPDPVTHRRVVVFLKPDLWLVWDDLSAPAAHHRLEALFHVHPDCRIAITPESTAFRLTSPGGRALRGKVDVRQHPGAALTVIQGDELERGAWFSPRYGARRPSHALSVRGALAGRCSLLTWFSTSDAANPIVSPQCGAIDVRVEHDGVEQSLFYRADPRGPSAPNNAAFDGTLLLERRTPGTLEIHARRFRELSLGDFRVRASATIDSLTLERDRCDITVSDELATVDVDARRGINTFVNRRAVDGPPPIVRRW